MAANLALSCGHGMWFGQLHCGNGTARRIDIATIAAMPTSTEMNSDAALQHNG
jgi:hypothetical protein